jgi:hypothetical protein
MSVCISVISSLSTLELIKQRTQNVCEYYATESHGQWCLLASNNQQQYGGAANLCCVWVTLITCVIIPVVLCVSHINYTCHNICFTVAHLLR